jgi:hypothetical protein
MLGVTDVQRTTEEAQPYSKRTVTEEEGDRRTER